MNNSQSLSCPCPLCDDYYPERYLCKHLLAEHTPEEIADQLAFIVIENAKADLLEEIEHQ